MGHSLLKLKFSKGKLSHLVIEESPVVAAGTKSQEVSDSWELLIQQY